MMLTPQARAVLFDLDGTLLDHDGARDAAIRAVLRARHTLSADDEDRCVREWNRLSDDLYEHYLAGEITFEQQRLGRITRFSGEVLDMGAGAPDAAWAVFHEYQHHYKRHWRAYEDVHPAIERLLDQGVSLAVVTNGNERQQPQKVARIGLTGIPVIVSGALGFSKPDPRIFTTACEAVNTLPQDCLMVGDNPKADVIGAHESGLQAVLLDRHSTVGAEHRHLPTITTLYQLFSE